MIPEKLMIIMDKVIYITIVSFLDKILDRFIWFKTWFPKAYMLEFQPKA